MEERVGYKILHNFHCSFNKGVSLDVYNLKRHPKIPLFLLNLIIRVYTLYRKIHVTSHITCLMILVVRNNRGNKRNITKIFTTIETFDLKLRDLINLLSLFAYS